MKISKTYFLFFFSLISGISYGQLEDYRLSDYKLPEFKRQSLDMKFDMSDDYSDKSYSEMFIQKHHFGLDPVLRYKRHVNNTDRQQFIRLDLGLGLDVDKSKTNDDEDKNTVSTLNIGSSYIDRFYNPKKNFLQLGMTTRYSYSSLDREAENDNEITNANFNIVPEIGLGKGRLEEVQYARKALYILKGLKDNGIINSDVSNEQVTGLADELAILAHRRYFDFRLNRIYSFQKIDSFMVANNLVDSVNGINYFTTIMDYWFYGAQRTRLQGERFTVFVRPKYEYRYSRETQERYSYVMGVFADAKERVYYNGWGIISGLKYEYHKPLDFKWQYRLTTSGYYTKEWIDVDTKKITTEGSTSKQQNNLELPALECYLINSIGYYPNTRTWLEIRQGNHFGYFFYRKNLSESHPEMEGALFRSDLEFNLSYYFSPRTQLEVKYNITYNKYNNMMAMSTSFSSTDMDYNRDLSAFSSSFSLSLNYAIF